MAAIAVISFESFQELLVAALPALSVVAFAAAGLALARWALLGGGRVLGAEKRLPRQLLMLGLTAVAVLMVIVALPLDAGTRQQLITLLGLILTAVVGISSTTFLSNAMAGLMLRSSNSFRPGDFVRVGDDFGRVTERGLFHTEIQTEDRDLTTLPNLYLVGRPMTVVHSTGTIVSARVSLGYDADRSEVERVLVLAANAADLEEPFVQIVELGDFSIVYRVAGFLAEPKRLLGARSKLRSSMVDELHRARIEIVSPGFMNQRQLDPTEPVMPEFVPRAQRRESSGDEGQARAFDKAEEAARLAATREEHDALATELKQLERELAACDDADRGRLERECALRRARISSLEVLLQEADEHANGE